MAENRWEWQPGAHVLLTEPIVAMTAKGPRRGTVYTVKEIYAGDSGRPYIRLREIAGGYLAIKFRQLRRLTPETFKTLTPEGSP